MTYILSADPGETTGIAILHDDAYAFWQIDCRTIQTFWQFLLDVKPDELMYEDFKQRPSLKKAELYSVQVIGVLRLYSEMYDVPIIFTCLPTEAKDWWDNGKITKIGLWRAGAKNEHAMDALRVLLRWRMKNDLAWFSSILPKFKDE